MEDAELVYELLTGVAEWDCCPIIQAQQVEDAFSEGTRCYELEQRIYQERLQLSESLTPEQERSLERILADTAEMNHILCLKMYQYAVQFTTQKQS